MQHCQKQCLVGLPALWPALGQPLRWILARSTRNRQAPARLIDDLTGDHPRDRLPARSLLNKGVLGSGVMGRVSQFGRLCWPSVRHVLVGQRLGATTSSSCPSRPARPGGSGSRDLGGLCQAGCQTPVLHGEPEVRRAACHEKAQPLVGLPRVGGSGRTRLERDGHGRRCRRSIRTHAAGSASRPPTTATRSGPTTSGAAKMSGK
jgi:hypothetical protein